jgi:hypothetical protein
MYWRKRFIVSVIISVIMILSVGGQIAAIGTMVPVNLAESKINPSPMMLYTNRTSTGISISTAGLAIATGNIVGYQGITDEVWIFLYLEKYTNGSWVTVDSWMQFFYSYRGFLQTATYVPSGYYYRTRATYYAFMGSNYEQTTGYSSVVYY